MPPFSIANLRKYPRFIAHATTVNTLVDKLLQQSGTLESRGVAEERVWIQTTLKKERGITILAKNTALNWNEIASNIVGSPGPTLISV